jgi:hypothetical protein
MGNPALLDGLVIALGIHTKVAFTDCSHSLINAFVYKADHGSFFNPAAL